MWGGKKVTEFLENVVKDMGYYQSSRLVSRRRSDFKALVVPYLYMVLSRVQRYEKLRDCGVGAAEEAYRQKMQSFESLRLDNLLVQKPVQCPDFVDNFIQAKFQKAIQECDLKTVNTCVKGYGESEEQRYQWGVPRAAAPKSHIVFPARTATLRARK